MSDLKVTNRADEHLIVGSIEVLGSTKSKDTANTKNALNNLQNTVSSLSENQKNFWSGIAADNIITPYEKKTLKKEMEQIRATYTAIIEEAEKAGIETAEEITKYQKSYRDLYSYIVEELKLFDDMTQNTELKNKERFNYLFENYYFNQSIAQSRVSAGAVTAVRTLTTLDTTGYEGEVAIYKNKLYRFTNASHTWEEVATNAYKGALKEFPEPVIDNFFLCVDEKDGQFKNVIFTAYLLIENKYLTETKAGKPIKATFNLTTGLIYRYTEQGWYAVTNRNDWRYIVASNDLIEYGYSLSPNLVEKIEIIAGDKQHTAKYLRVITEVPLLYGNGDFFVWNNNIYKWNYASGKEIFLETGCLYKFNKPEWTKVNPQDAAYNNEIMAALDDLITIHGGTDAYFSNIFVKKIFALEAVIQELSSQMITLQKGGVIQSENFVSSGGAEGFKIDSNGNIRILGEAYIGKKAIFKGNIESGPLYLSDEEPGTIERIIHFPEGRFYYYNAKNYPLSEKGNGTYLNFDFSYFEFSRDYTPNMSNTYTNYLKLYDDNLNLITKIYANHSSTGPNHSTDYYIDLEGDFIFQIPNKTGFKTFKLFNLPKYPDIPSTPSTIYIKDNRLMITDDNI